MILSVARFFVIFALVMLAGCSESAQEVPAPTPDTGMPEEDAGDAGEVPDTTSGDPVVTEVVVAPDSPVISVGDNLQFVATPFDADGNVIEIGAGDPIWESSDPTVAPISSGGRVVAATVGTTEISATFQDVTATVELTVATTVVDAVEVLPPEVIFTIGDSFDFLAVPRDPDGERIDSGLEATWRIEDTSVATVEGATVTAVGAGETELVATIQGVEGRANIIVEDAVLTELSIDQPDQTLIPGERYTFSASFTWQDAEPANLPTVSWASSDPSVTVESTGEVTAVSPGSATITASVGDVSDTVVVTVPREFEQMAAGESHTCARLLGAVYCWGSNDEGQLGHSESGFARVTGIPLAQDLAAGRAHTCIRSTSGEVMCWGANNAGQLGLGNTTPGLGKTPVSMARAGNLIADRDLTCAGGVCWGDLVTSTALTPQLLFEDLYPGAGHVCSVDSSGSTDCEGANDQGQLGINSTSATGSGSPVGGYDFNSLALGDDFSCGDVQGGGMACWGDGDRGQIGDGDFMDVQVPILTPLLAVPAQIATGDTHVCVLTPSGQVWCWGGNGDGQVGNGTMVDTGSPVEVSGNQTFISIDAAGNRSCGLTADGDVWCWGANEGSSPTRFVPTW